MFMRIGRWLLFLFLFLFSAVSACTKGDSVHLKHDAPILVTVVPDVKGRDADIPIAIEEILRSLKSENSNVVEKELGFPAFEKMQLFNIKTYVEYMDGWLIASGRGEWGGVVFWIDKKGNYEIIQDDDLAYPIDLIADGNTLFLLQGMSHLLLADGHLLEISRDDGVFSTIVYPINLYPTNFKKLDGRWIIPAGANKGYFVLSELRAGKHHFHTPR